MCHRFLASAIFWATRARVDGYKCELKDAMHNDSGVSRANYSGNTRSLATSGFTLLTFAQREVEDVVLAVSKPAIWRCLCALAVVPRAQPSRAIAAATRFTAVLSEECRSAHLEAGNRIKCADDVEAAAPTAATAAPPTAATAAPPPAGESERMTIAICNLDIYILAIWQASGRPNNAQQTFLRRMSVAVAAETRLCLLLLR